VKKLVNILNQPFPSTCNPKKEFLELVWVSLFVAVFLYFFQPFGFSKHTGNKLWLASQFGLVTLAVSYGYFLITFYLLRIRQDQPSWTFVKWIFNVLVLLLLIAVGNLLLLNYVFNLNNYGWSGLIFMIPVTFAVGIFPVVISGLVSMLRHERQLKREAASITADLKVIKNEEDDFMPIKIPSQSDQTLELPVNCIYFLEAMENYVAVHFSQGNELKRELVRNTLSAIDQQLPSQHFMRCHRSYVVNLHQIDHVNGNAQGLTLHLHKFPHEKYVPVSRKYIPELRHRLA